MRSPNGGMTLARPDREQHLGPKQFPDVGGAGGARRAAPFAQIDQAQLPIPNSQCLGRQTPMPWKLGVGALGIDKMAAPSGLPGAGTRRRRADVGGHTAENGHSRVGSIRFPRPIALARTGDMTNSNRRDFIRRSLAGTAGVMIGGAGISARSYAAIKGANERINVAVIGIRNQGTVHLQKWCGLKDSHNVQVRTLCDADERCSRPGVRLVEEKTGVEPATEWDLRRVLDDKTIDAVSIVTPNHWHALAAVLACQAGKHVYVEKPASHNIWEGRKMIEAAAPLRRAHAGRAEQPLVTQRARGHRVPPRRRHRRRSTWRARSCFKARDSYGMAKDGEPPADIPLRPWLGPAPLRPYNEKRGHYNWHWYWDTGNGDTGNTGPHQLDIARWGLAKDEHPVSVYSAGGIYGFRQDDGAPTPGKRVYGGVETYGHDKTTQETPNTQTAVYKYADGTLLELETRGRYTNHEGSQGQEVGNLFFGADGWLEISGDTWKAFREREREPFAGSKEGEAGGQPLGELPGGLARRARTRRCIATSARGTSPPRCATSPTSRIASGRSLTFRGASETFASDTEADALLTRAYRPPFVTVVPERGVRDPRQSSHYHP